MTEQTDAPLNEVFKPAATDDLVVRRMVEALDGQDAAPGIQRLRGWSLAAARLLPGSTVMDVGSGTGTMSRHFAGVVGAEGRVVGVEPNPVLRGIAEERAAAAEVRVEFVEASATELPFEDESFDVVWCERVLQHLPDAQAAIIEIARVLKPDGRIGISDVVAEDRLTELERAERGSYVGCIAGAFSKAEYEAGLEAAGFRDVSVEFTHAVADGMHGAIVKGVKSR